MSRFSDFVDKIENELNDSSVKFVKSSPDRAGQHGPRRRIHFYLSGGDIEKTSQAGGRIVDGYQVRAPVVYERLERIEIVVFAENQDTLDVLIDNLINAIDHSSPNGGVLFSSYEYDYDQYSKRIPIIRMVVEVKLPVTDEQKDLVIITDESHICRFDTGVFESANRFELTSKSFDFSDVSTTTEGFSFSDDGETAWLLGEETGGENTLYEYSLTAPYDISTLEYNDVSIEVQQHTESFRWYSNGKKLLTIASNYVYKWNVATAWDITTASVDGYYDMEPDFEEYAGFTGSQINVRSVNVSPDERTFTAVNLQNRILQYKLRDDIEDIFVINYVNLNDIATLEFSPQELCWLNSYQFVLSYTQNEIVLVTCSNESDYIISSPTVSDGIFTMTPAASFRGIETETLNEDEYMYALDKNSSTLYETKYI